MTGVIEETREGKTWEARSRIELLPASGTILPHSGPRLPTSESRSRLQSSTVHDPAWSHFPGKNNPVYSQRTPRPSSRVDPRDADQTSARPQPFLSNVLWTSEFRRPSNPLKRSLEPCIVLGTHKPPYRRPLLRVLLLRRQLPRSKHPGEVPHLQLDCFRGRRQTLVDEKPGQNYMHSHGLSGERASIWQGSSLMPLQAHRDPSYSSSLVEVNPNALVPRGAYHVSKSRRSRGHFLSSSVVLPSSRDPELSRPTRQRVSRTPQRSWWCR